MKNPPKKEPNCKYCYDKKYFSVAEGGTIAMGDFLGEKPYKVPLKIAQHPYSRCNKPNEFWRCAKHEAAGNTDMGCLACNEENKKYPNLHNYPITICDGCIALKGQMCDTPGCAFIRCTMKEVKELLDQTQICPLVDGERVYTVNPIKNHNSSLIHE